jgi:hypothetical protein
VEVHLAAHRDDGVGFGVLVYADLEVQDRTRSSLLTK